MGRGGGFVPGTRRLMAGFLAATAVLASIAACSPSNDSASSVSCTGLGNYSFSLAVNGSNPLLPDSIQGRDYTPLVRLGGTHEDQDPATVFLSLFAGLPEPATTQDFKGLKLGEEITFRGYTLKITSICDGNAGFDLVSQAE